MPKYGPTADVQPGDYIRNWCREHEIAFPNHMRSLKAKLPKNPFQLSAFCSRHHCIDIKSMRYFDKYEHPFARTVFDIYVAKKKTPLWYGVFGGTGARPFVVSTAEQKLKHALRDALASHGYDRDGRRMASVGDDSVIADLFGTLKLSTAEPKMVCNSKFADLVRDMEFVVGVAEVELRRGRDGRHLSDPAPRQQSSRGGSNWKDTRQRDDRVARSKPAGGYSRTSETGRKVNNDRSWRWE